MHTFNYLFLKNCRVDSILLNRISNLERLREKTVEIEYRDPNLTSAMEKRAILMSVVDSNAIEGIYTSEGRINGLISGRTAPRGHYEEEILGYRDVLRYIHSNHKKINLNKETLLEIYSMLMFHTETEDLGFKTRDNVIAERDADGTLLMLHRTVPAEKTEWCIDQLLGAFWEARNDLAINKLLLIPCVIMDFLRIHPFIDGNGRMSRLLTTLLLYQEGYDICKFTSMESKINSSKNQYYDSLAQFGALSAGIKVGEAKPLFARIDKDEMFEKIKARQEANAAAETANNAKVKEELAGVAQIGIEDFGKVELRVAEIKACEPIKRAKKLLKLTLDDGEGERTVASGIAPWYQPDDLVGHKVVIVANLKPATLCGVESQGMILAADTSDGNVQVLFVDSMETGAKLR